MTAYHLYARPDAAYLLSDGAACDRDGKVVEIVSKPQLFPQFNMALAVNGYLDDSWVAEDMAALAPQNVDDAIAALPAIAFGITGRNRYIGVPFAWVSIFAICWHPQHGACVFAANSGGPAAGELPIGKAVRLRAYLGGIHDPSGVLGRPVDVLDPASFDIATDGLKLMERERIMPVDPGLGHAQGDKYGVGGFVELTSVSPTGIAQRRLREWPEDRVGERINPHTSQTNALEAA